MKNLFIILAVLNTACLFVFFGYQVMYQGYALKDMARGLLIMLSPVPLAVFAAYVIAPRAGIGADISEPAGALFSLVVFAGSLAASIGLAVAWNATSIVRIEATPLPLMINSSALCLHVVNFFRTRSAAFAGLLSGTGIGIVTYIILLT